MKENATRTTGWFWLTAPVAVLLVIATGNSLLIEGVFHRDKPYLAAQAVGQDFVTLAVALPALVISVVLARRGSETASIGGWRAGNQRRLDSEAEG